MEVPGLPLIHIFFLKRFIMDHNEIVSTWYIAIIELVRELVISNYMHNKFEQDTLNFFFKLSCTQG